MTDPDDDGPPLISVERGSLRVEGRDVAAAPAVDVARWCEVALRALEGEGLAGGQVDLHFVGRDEMAALNEAHLGGSGPTDVLSFPYEDDPRAVAAADVLLGDVVVCAQVASEQAPDHAGTFDDELALLVVHGVLHVLGWDHAEPDEAGRMQRREAELLAAADFAFHHPALR